MQKDKHPGTDRSDTATPVEIRDLSDFCQQWTTIRQSIENENNFAEQLDVDQRVIIDWLIKLADRVCQTEEI